MSTEGKENTELENQEQTIAKSQEPQYEVKIIGEEEKVENTNSPEVVNEEKQDATQIETKKETEPDKKVETTNTSDPYGEDFKSKVVSYLKENGKEVESFEDAFKAPEVIEKIVEKEVNPFADTNFDEDDLNYFKFKKDYPNLGRKEYNFIQQDLDAISPIDLAKQRIEKETGQKVTKAETVEYLEDKYNMDLSDLESLTAREKIDLQTFVKPIKDEMASQKEKYKQPQEPKTQNGNEDFVTLENGTTMSKQAYKEQTDIRNEFLKQVNDLPNNVGKLSFKFNVDDGGIEKEMDFDYDLSKDDTQEMVSKLSDIDGTIKKNFSNKDGSVNAKALGIALQFGTQEKLGKLLDSAYQRGRADLAEAQAKVDNNVNFNSSGMTRKNTPGDFETKTVPVEEIYNR